MSFCEKYNITLAIPIADVKSIFYTEDFKTVKGFLGKIMQKFLDSRKNYPYRCKLKPVNDVGQKLQNGSYNGALGLIDKKENDFFLRFEIPFTDNQNVCFSVPANPEEFIVSHFINKKIISDLELKMQLLRSFELEFMVYCILVFLLFLIVFVFFSYLLSLKLQINYSVSKLKKLIELKRNNSFNLILLGCLFYRFFIQQIMTNNIKTTKVIVDTSQLITNEEKLFESPLKVAWVKGESDLTFVKTAPNHTFLNKLFSLKNDKPIKIIETNYHPSLSNETKYYFLFMKSLTSQIVMNFIGFLQDGDGFLNEKPFFNTYSVLYICKKINSVKLKNLQETFKYYVQAGLASKAILDMKSFEFIESSKNFKIYKTKKSYIDDFTKFGSLNYENFHFFFLVYFISSFFILLVFIVYN